MDVLRAPAGRLVLLALVACGGSAPGAAGPSARGEVLAAESAPAQEDATDARAGEPLDEASARRLIAGRFRAAGLRIVEDVTIDVDGVTLVADGFDPARRVGYEYVAAEERGLELDAAERERLAGVAAVRILVSEAAAGAELERAIEAFLAELPASP